MSKKNGAIHALVLISTICAHPLYGFKDSGFKSWGRDTFYAVGALGGCLYLLDRTTGFYFRSLGCDTKSNSSLKNRRSRISKHQALIEDLEKKIKQLHEELSGWEKQVDTVMPIVEECSTQITQLNQQFKSFTTHAKKSPQEPVTRSALLAYEGQLTQLLLSLEEVKKRVDCTLEQEKTERNFVEKRVFDIKKRQDELSVVLTSIQAEVTNLKQQVEVIDSEVFEPETQEPINKEGGRTQPALEKK